MRSGAAEAVDVDLLAKRHSSLHLLQFTSQGGRAPHKTHLRRGQQVLAAQVDGVAHGQVVLAPAPC